MRKGWDCDYDKRPLPEPEVKPMRNSVTLKYNKQKCMPIEIVFHLYNGDDDDAWFVWPTHWLVFIDPLKQVSRLRANQSLLLLQSD